MAKNFWNYVLLLLLSGLAGLSSLLTNQSREISRGQLDGESMLVAGVVTSRSHDQVTLKAPGGVIRVHFKEDQVPRGALTTIHPGDKIVVMGLFSAPKPASNPHDFDAVSYFNANNWLGSIRNVSGVVVLHGSGHSGWRFRLFSLQMRLVQRIRERFPSTLHQGLIEALLLGKREGLDPLLVHSFRNAGISHILAISGLHVGIIASLVFFLLKIPLARIPFSERVRTLFRCVLSLFVLWVFALFVGFSASVVRASLMTTVFLVGQGIQRNMTGPNSLGRAYFLVLLFRPGDLTSIGFQLSFAAVLFIFIGIHYHGIGSSRPRTTAGFLTKIKLVVLISFWAALGTAPLLCFHFGAASLTTLLASPIAVPLLSIVLPLLVLSILSPFSFFPVILFSKIGLDILIQIGSIASDLPFMPSFRGPIGTIPPLLVLTLTAVFLLVGSCTMAVRRSLLMVYFLFSLWLTFKENNVVVVTFLDVGQGDALVVQAPNGRALVVDTGPNRWSGISLARHIDGEAISGPVDVVLTHQHLDHTGGLAGLIEGMESSTGAPRLKTVKRAKIVTRVWHAGWIESTDPIFSSLRGGYVLSLDNRLRIYVLNPPQHGGENNDSIVLLLKYGQNSVLLMGDAEKNSEKWVSSMYDSLINVDLLKVGHHGSNTSSISFFIDAVEPKTSVISVGQKNAFGHPSPEVINRLLTSGSSVYTTSENGALIFLLNGRQLKQKKIH